MFTARTYHHHDHGEDGCCGGHGQGDHGHEHGGEGCCGGGVSKGGWWLPLIPVVFRFHCSWLRAKPRSHSVIYARGIFKLAALL